MMFGHLLNGLAPYGSATNAYGDALANAYRNISPEAQDGPKARTEEEIQAQLEARYTELEAIANSHEKLRPCKACRWVVDSSSDYARCKQPLVMGFGNPATGMDGWTYPEATLCGLERALWEPRIPMLRRLWNWFLEPFVASESDADAA